MPVVIYTDLTRRVKSLYAHEKTKFFKVKFALTMVQGTQTMLNQRSSPRGDQNWRRILAEAVADQPQEFMADYKMDFTFSNIYLDGSLCTMVPLKPPSFRYKYTAALWS